MADETKTVRDYPAWMDQDNIVPAPLKTVCEFWLHSASVTEPPPDWSLCAMSSRFLLAPEDVGVSLNRHARIMVQYLMVPMRDLGYLVMDIRMDTHTVSDTTTLGSYGHTAILTLRRFNQQLLHQLRNEPVHRLDEPVMQKAAEEIVRRADITTA